MSIITGIIITLRNLWNQEYTYDTKGNKSCPCYYPLSHKYFGSDLWINNYSRFGHVTLVLVSCIMFKIKELLSVIDVCFLIKTRKVVDLMYVMAVQYSSYRITVTWTDCKNRQIIPHWNMQERVSLLCHASNVELSSLIITVTADLCLTRVWLSRNDRQIKKKYLRSILMLSFPVRLESCLERWGIWQLHHCCNSGNCY